MVEATGQLSDDIIKKESNIIDEKNEIKLVFKEFEEKRL